MQVIKVSQTADRETWLQYRLGKITGAKAKGIKPLTRGADRTPQGFWILLAEKLAIITDGGESDLERGQRLENEALRITAEKYSLNLNLDPGMWVSDDNPDIAVSPDAAEDVELPTYAAEAKCLSSANHLKYVVKDLRARKSEDYKAIDYVPNEAKSAYREQVIQYFIVNEKLRTLYFTLYDERISLEKYMHHVIVINREDIEDEIQEQKQMQLETLAEIDKLIEEMEG